MFFSSGRLNVLEDLIRSGRIEIYYTYGKSNKAMHILDGSAFKTRLLPQILETMSQDGGTQRVGFKITPRLARGQKFTTGNEALDDLLAGNALLFIEGGCDYPDVGVRVDTLPNEQHLVFPKAYVRLTAVHGNRNQTTSAWVRGLTISTKGIVSFDRISTT